jgi:hypothetical protein
MTKDNYKGPTADEAMPTQRINEGALYQEHLVQMFGEQQALRGIPLEVVDAVPGTIKGDASGKKVKPTVWLTFKGPDGKALLPWKLGINATIRKALIARFDSRVLAEWVGWVTLHVDPNVEDKRTGEKVRAIRVKSSTPKLAATFDYAANVEKRIERARKSRAPAGAKGKSAAPAAVELTPEQRAALDAADEESTATAAGEFDLAEQVRAQMERAATAGSGIADEEREAIAAAERAQFTPDPEDES